MSNNHEPDPFKGRLDGVDHLESATPLEEASQGASGTTSRPQPQPLRRESSQRVRFSAEVARSDDALPLSAGRPARLSIEPVPAHAFRVPMDGHGGDVAHPQVPCISPTSPSSSRKRNRGYSLRRQLFFRNAQDQLDEEATKFGGTTAVAHSSSSDTLELERLAIPPSLEPKKRSDDTDEEVDHGNPRRRRSSLGNVAMRGYSLGIPSYYRTLKNRISPHLVYLKKTILRQHSIPPSKEGRKIPVEAQRKEPLVDERTGEHYVNNTIRSSRYTVWNFLPKQLFAQFSKLANFYFLCVSILQMIPTLSTTGTYTTIVPLLFFISLSLFKEGYDDYRRYKLDKKENNRDAQVFHVYRPTAEGTAGARLWARTKWKDIRVGDIVRLERNDWVPADLLILYSDGAHGIAYIETMALDGETNLKSKQALPLTAEGCDTPENLAAFRAEVVVEDPNLDLYNFEGKVNIRGDTKPLTNNQVVYRGSVLRNTPSMVGLVIFTGEETKIRMNANKNPRTKAPALQARVNRIVICVVIFVLALSTFCTGAYQIWRNRIERKSWYLTNISVAFFPILASYIIMFNTLIPLSLYVSLEIVKLAQMYLLNDIDMYHKETDTPLEARTSTINEDCGQVSYIFSDKTGTLTDNSMLFRKLSVGGHAWLHDLDIQRRTDQEAGNMELKRKKRKGKGRCKDKKIPKRAMTFHGERLGYTRKSMSDAASPQSQISPQKMSLDGVLGRKRSSNSLKWVSSAVPTRPQPQLSTIDLLEYLSTHPHTFFARKARFFLLSIALCHTCLPEADADGSIQYQAASPDELALVKAAQELGYITIERQVNSITIKTFPNGSEGAPLVEVYEILEVIEFSSKRKRMSIIIRLPNGKICILSKGADTTMIELLRLREIAKGKALEVGRRASIRKSMEAQEVIRRNSVHRPSVGGRTSFGGPSRPSMNLNRLKPIRDEFDDWLRERKSSVDMSSLDGESLYSRPSGQFAARHSIAFGDVPNSLLDDAGDDLVDENLAVDDARVFERCFAHVNHFATEGLRTLLYGHRFIEEEEYLAWRRIYAEASTSLVDRQALVESAAEIIERDYELTGATAIEDKLQKGVPEAIDKLRRAGIKLWMLTGDKRETAINIGHSCRLIRDYSDIVVLDQEQATLTTTIKSAIADIKAGTVAHSVVVVDGGTLATIENDENLKALFFDVAVRTDSVICCRASPSQKASLVRTIRTKVQRSVTLAIGDGANDIAMIQEAHVGVGITGKEGLQAARVSDYSMAQFRFLLKFLLVHGRWNYIRTCKYTLGTFWKELLFYLTQALFQLWNGYTGSSFYEPWSLSMFNTLFTSLPVIFMGVFEKDLAASTLLAVPELYQKGQKNGGFNFKIYLGWMFVAICQAMTTFFMVFSLYAPRIMVDQSVFAMGCLSFSVCITVISAKLQLIELHNKTIMAAIGFLLSVGGWFMWNIILSAVYNKNTIHDVKGGITTRFGRELPWWLVFVFTVSACLIFDVSLITIRAAFWPTDVDTFQEIEKSSEMRRLLEEAASEELQQGRIRDKGKPSNVCEREAAVQEILDRPRDMEEGRSGSPKNAVSPAPLVEAEDMDAMVARRFGSVRRT